MKNLILPFVVFALFAIGSCGDDNSVNTSSNTIKYNQINGGSITLEKIPCTLKSTRTERWGQLPEKTFDTEINLQSKFVQHPDSSNLIKNDTLTLITNIENREDKSTDSRKASSTTSHSNTINIVLDTLNQRVRYIRYTNSTRRSSDYKTKELHFSSGSSTSDTSFSFILVNVPYTRDKDSLVIILKPIQSTYISEFGYSDYSTSGSSSNSGKTWEQSASHYYLSNLLPFKEESAIRIALFCPVK